MGLHKYFFRNRLVQAQELNQLSRAQARSRQRRARIAKHNDERFEALEEDLGYVSLVLGALLHKLDEQGTLRRAEVQSLMSELDELDGVRDGRLHVDILKANADSES